MGRRKTPEELELDRKRAELGAAETQLAQDELDLATLRATLVHLEARYLRVVGSRYAELDDLNARIAEALANQAPEDQEAHAKATHARVQAQQSASVAGAIPWEQEEQRFKPSEDLKRLFREVAKALHPDLTTDEEGRIQRTRLMAEANQAYQQGDHARLEAILREWETSPDAVQGEGPGPELIRAIRKLSQITERLAAIRIETERLKHSDLFRLKFRMEEAESHGRDLFAEMAFEIGRQIEAARRRLAQLAVSKAAP